MNCRLQGGNCLVRFHAVLANFGMDCLTSDCAPFFVLWYLQIILHCYSTRRSFSPWQVLSRICWALSAQPWMSRFWLAKTTTSDRHADTCQCKVQWSPDRRQDENLRDRPCVSFVTHRWACCRCAEPPSWLHVWWNQRISKNAKIRPRMILFKIMTEDGHG